MMRYLVTGGAGFIGSHLVDALIAGGASEVCVLDNFRRGRREHLTQHAANPVLCLHEGDIRDADLVRRLCDSVDVVFHLAAQSNVMGASADALYSVESNVVGTVNVLQACLEAGVSRVIFTSSREVYGDPEALPVSEETPFAPKNAYGASKVAGEMYCRAYQNRGLDVRVLRFGNVFGTRDRDRVIPIWLDRAQAGLDLEVYGGRQFIDFVPVDLIVEALLRTVALDAYPGPINVASGKGTPIVDLAERILALAETESRVSYLPARQEEVIGFVADVTKMQRDLGLLPPTDPLASLSTLLPAARGV